MERREQAERFCEGKFSKNSAIGWLKRGLVVGPEEEEIHVDT